MCFTDFLISYISVSVKNIHTRKLLSENNLNKTKFILEIQVELSRKQSKYSFYFCENFFIIWQHYFILVSFHFAKSKKVKKKNRKAVAVADFILFLFKEESIFIYSSASYLTIGRLSLSIQ